MPPPNITWLKDDKVVRKTVNVYTIVITQTIGHLKGCLVFEMNNGYNMGNYTLVATNEHGTTNRSVYVDFSCDYNFKTCTLKHRFISCKWSFLICYYNKLTKLYLSPQTEETRVFALTCHHPRTIIYVQITIGHWPSWAAIWNKQSIQFDFLY